MRSQDGRAGSKRKHRGDRDRPCDGVGLWTGRRASSGPPLISEPSILCLWGRDSRMICRFRRCRCHRVPRRSLRNAAYAMGMRARAPASPQPRPAPRRRAARDFRES